MMMTFGSYSVFFSLFASETYIHCVLDCIATNQMSIFTKLSQQWSAILGDRMPTPNPSTSVITLCVTAGVLSTAVTLHGWNKKKAPANTPRTCSHFPTNENQTCSSVWVLRQLLSRAFVSQILHQASCQVQSKLVALTQMCTTPPVRPPIWEVLARVPDSAQQDTTVPAASYDPITFVFPPIQWHQAATRLRASVHTQRTSEHLASEVVGVTVQIPLTLRTADNAAYTKINRVAEIELRWDTQPLVQKECVVEASEETATAAAAAAAEAPPPPTSDTGSRMAELSAMWAPAMQYAVYHQLQCAHPHVHALDMRTVQEHLLCRVHVSEDVVPFVCLLGVPEACVIGAHLAGYIMAHNGSVCSDTHELASQLFASCSRDVFPTHVGGPQHVRMRADRVSVCLKPARPTVGATHKDTTKKGTPSSHPSPPSTTRSAVVLGVVRCADGTFANNTEAIQMIQTRVNEALREYHSSKEGGCAEQRMNAAEEEVVVKHVETSSYEQVKPCDDGPLFVFRIDEIPLPFAHHIASQLCFDVEEDIPAKQSASQNQNSTLDKTCCFTCQVFQAVTKDEVSSNTSNTADRAEGEAFRVCTVDVI
jgi:hypothetical protein